MPSPEAISTLATAIADIFSSGLPEADPSLPQETQDAINDAMNDARDKNQVMGQQLANAINAFITSASVGITISWSALRGPITRNLNSYALLTHTDIAQAETPQQQDGYNDVYMPVHLSAGLSYDYATDEEIHIEGNIG